MYKFQDFPTLMNTFFVFILILGLVSASLEQKNVKVQDSTIIEQINSDSSVTWTAKLNPLFADLTVSEFQGRYLGFKRDEKIRAEYKHLLKRPQKPSSLSIPDQFDWREQMGECVGAIRDQGDCGSCWAFGCTESLADRFCIQSNASTQVVLSVQELVSCNLEGLEGCHGGDPVTAFIYTSVAGLVEDACIPYQSGNGTAPSCFSLPHGHCEDSSYPWDKYYSIVDTLRWHDSVESIQEDIVENGPVEACFEVYEDFLSYSSGVYEHVTGSALGGHCIKIIGWGVDNSTQTPYWICANSWGVGFGMDGFFYIERGVDMCGIEKEVFSASAKV